MGKLKGNIVGGVWIYNLRLNNFNVDILSLEQRAAGHLLPIGGGTVRGASSTKLTKVKLLGF